jgi:hypothetical protein
MQGLNSLIEHWIDSNDLGTTLPTFIPDLSELISLSLTDCNLVGTLPSEYGSFASSRFENLYLYDNNLMGTIPTEMGLNRLVEIYQFEGNDFTGVMPAEVCALRERDDGFGQRLGRLGVDCDEVQVRLSVAL